MTNKQRVFRQWTSGILLYAVVMGFFNDYTEFLTISSFSTVFFAAVVMQALTFATFGLKRRVVDLFQGRSGTGSMIAKGLSIWAIMFFSKFVFIEVINIVFGSAVEISGFVGLVLIIAAMVIVTWIIDTVDEWLATETGALRLDT